MSSIVIPDEAKLNWATAQIENVPTLTDCFLRLYKSAVEIDRYTTLSELLANECDFPGYSPIALENWSSAVLVDTEAITEADVVTFNATADSGGNVYGCFAANGAGDQLWFASPFDETVPVPFSSELQMAIQLAIDAILFL